MPRQPERVYAGMSWASCMCWNSTTHNIALITHLSQSYKSIVLRYTIDPATKGDCARAMRRRGWQGIPFCCLFLWKVAVWVDFLQSADYADIGSLVICRRLIPFWPVYIRGPESGISPFPFPNPWPLDLWNDQVKFVTPRSYLYMISQIIGPSKDCWDHLPS